ncbi:hypothetical protein NFI96_022082 [Prochilodus magdalenae]|nr:hypothetical protein NFI96_022082 [Prochilodus magdalenae]
MQCWCFAAVWDIIDTNVYVYSNVGFYLYRQILSFLAFVLEEIVNSCSSCGPLYFFEFVSCTAFLFTLLLLILLITPLYQKVGITCWPELDFGYTVAILVLFILASVVFLADNSGTSVESTAAVFGILASLAFLVDVGLFIKTKGIPCAKKKQETTTGPVTESEKLNANGSGNE